MRPIYKAVTSSNIGALAYADGKLWVEFLSGRRFAYDAPQSLFDQMMDLQKAKKSVGGFFAKEVKGKCQVAWVGQRCSNSPCQSDATLVGETAGVPFYVCDACKGAPQLAGVHLKPIPPRETKP